jgi:release factor glutamine methyltransferase
LVSLLAWLSGTLADACSDPEFEALVLLEEITGQSGEQVLALAPKDLSPLQHRQLEHCRAARCLGVPLQYVVGYWDFYGARFRLRPPVLIPRSDTEVLVEAALERLPLDAAGAAVDLGCGTGILAITLKRLRPQLVMQAVDVDPRAVALTRQNALRLGVDIDVQLADYRQGLASSSFALIVANPPYIPRGELAELDPSVRAFEASTALDGGENGLDLVDIVLRLSAAHLAPGGLLAMEMGWQQGPAIRDRALERGLKDVQVLPDLAGAR